MLCTYDDNCIGDAVAGTNPPRCVLHSCTGETVFESGAKRSEKVPPYHLIPPEALERLAKRYGMGADKYGILNYFKGINDPAFVRQIIDHMEQHLHDYKVNGCEADDNLAGIMWGAATLMLIEKHNSSIVTDSILGPRRTAIDAAVKSARPEQPLYEGAKTSTKENVDVEKNVDVK